MVPYFCVNLMYMRDTMHQIDLGVIISFFKAILRKYLGCIATVLHIPGKAAKKLTTRLQLALKEYTCKSGQKYSGKHSCLLPLTYGISTVFHQLSTKKKTSRHYRATDYRNLFLLLPFILENLFLDEVETFNTANQGQMNLIDPSAELVAVAT